MATCKPAAPADAEVRDRMSIVVVGSVDHGKSTLLGRLYADTGALPEGKVEKIQAICKQQGKAFEYAFLFDAFLEEQQQGVTIDTARTFFQWEGRQYILIDAPGHKEFLKNMISGAARADAALLLIDAVDGVRDQSKRHGLLLSMLGVGQITVIVNKMDLVEYRQETFQAIEREYRDFLAQLNVTPRFVIPGSARHGDNIVTAGSRMSWYAGPTVLESLTRFSTDSERERRPLRFPIQDVYKFDADRILAGRLTSGRLRVGDTLVFSPSNKTAVVRTIEAFHVDPPPTRAHAGQSVGITLDEHIFVERGEIVCHASSLPFVSTTFHANLFWLGRRPLRTDAPYALRLATRELECRVTAIHRIMDANDLSTDARGDAASVRQNEVASITIRARAPLAFDRYADYPDTGCFVLVDGYDVAGGGIITEMVRDRETPLRAEARQRDFAWVKGNVTAAERAAHYGHHAALVLLIGPDAAGKTFLAKQLESVLVADGRHAYMLDPENLRRGLDADLRERNVGEMIRRYGEVARLIMDTGSLLISTTNSFSLPDDEALDAIRALVHPAPVLTAYMSRETAPAPLPSDLCFTGPEDFTAAAHDVLAALTRQGILTDSTGTPPAFHVSI